MKGIILAGGSGSRLYPLTKSMSKQLLPIYDKPMIYYPLSILMLANIKEVLIISTSEHIPKFKNLLGDGSNIGMQFDFIEQHCPDGIAQAFTIGKDFIGASDVCLILGDNIFYGDGMTGILSNALSNAKNKNLATIFAYQVNKPESYGIVNFDTTGKALGIEEKPKKPKSNYAVTGLYFYPNDVIKKAAKVLPSDRGELEITTVNQMYLEEQRLYIEIMSRGYAWLDTGTYEGLLAASLFVQTIEKRQSLKVACIEEIAFEKGYISKKKLRELGKSLEKNEYGKYLLDIVNR